MTMLDKHAAASDAQQFMVEFADGSRGVLVVDLSPAPPGPRSVPPALADLDPEQLAKFELAYPSFRRSGAENIAGHLVALDLDRSLVAAAVARSVGGSIGDGVITEIPADLSPAKPAHWYRLKDQQLMAVYDYLIGVGNRSPDSYGTSLEGRPVVTSNPGAFPARGAFGVDDYHGPRPHDPHWLSGYRRSLTIAHRMICSDFVMLQLGSPLPDEILTRLRAIDLAMTRSSLLHSGLGRHEIDGYLDRLREIRSYGRITGEAWYGSIEVAVISAEFRADMTRQGNDDGIQGHRNDGSGSDFDGPSYIDGISYIDDFRVELPNGHYLQCRFAGAHPREADKLIFQFHGSLGSRVDTAPDHVLHQLKEENVCLVTYDRPGYGLSTRQKDISIAESGKHVRYIADHLASAYGNKKLTDAKILLVGRSGGTPYATAAAAELGPRCGGLALLVPVAPPQRMGEDFTKGMFQQDDPNNEFESIRRKVANFLGSPSDPMKIIGTERENFGEIDRLFLDNNSPLLCAMYHEGLRKGSDGWFDDITREDYREWEIRTEEIASNCPIFIFTATGDGLVPPAHTMEIAGELKEAGKKCTVFNMTDEGAGHFVAPQIKGDVYDGLLRGTMRADLLTKNRENDPRPLEPTPENPVVIVNVTYEEWMADRETALRHEVPELTASDETSAPQPRHAMGDPTGSRLEVRGSDSALAEVVQSLDPPHYPSGSSEIDADPGRRTRWQSRDFVVTSPDGQRLQCRVEGPENGTPIIQFHGTPGSRVDTAPPELLDQLGIRLVTYDRPGYGGSAPPREGMTIADGARHVAAIADHLGIDRFAVVGRSGGTPYAAAAAALLPDRVTKAALLVPTASPALMKHRLHEGKTQQRGLDRPIEQVSAERLAALRANPTDPMTVIGIPFDQLGPGDQAIVRKHSQDLCAMYTEGMKNGSTGWVGDSNRKQLPWGYEYGDIQCPTMVWTGSEDGFTPPAHAESIAAQLPSGQLYTVGQVGHFGAMEIKPGTYAWLSGREDLARFPTELPPGYQPGTPIPTTLDQWTSLT
ncbi:alpha/beta fold hydrolase [Nocardia sp. NPDC004260]